MIMNVFRTIEPISWMLGPKWETKQRSKQGLQCRILTPPPPFPHGPLPGISPLTYPFRINHCLPHVRESKKVLDSGFHAVDSGFQVLDSSLFQWNLDSGSNRWWYSGFLELYSESTRKNFPDYRIRIPLHGDVLFKVRRARVIKYKPQGIYWQPMQGGSGGELTTPESTITYHNALCLSPQNFA